MLAQARADVAIDAVQGAAEQLPFADASFDFLSMGYALRHVTDLRGVFAEYARVLRPGGRVCVLEIAPPAGRVSRALMEMYFRGVLPVISRFAGRQGQTRALWRYYWDTIDQCVPGETIWHRHARRGLCRREAARRTSAVRRIHGCAGVTQLPGEIRRHAPVPLGKHFADQMPD